jgi:hypothetical protein
VTSLHEQYYLKTNKKSSISLEIKREAITPDIASLLKGFYEKEFLLH